MHVFHKYLSIKSLMAMAGGISEHMVTSWSSFFASSPESKDQFT